MHEQRSQQTPGVRRRELLTAGLAAGITLSVWPLAQPPALWGTEGGPPRRGGILRVRGLDPVHFDHHLTLNARTNTTLSFIHSTLLRYKVGPEIVPGERLARPRILWGGSPHAVNCPIRTASISDGRGGNEPS
jgi:hypothetical protein